MTCDAISFQQATISNEQLAKIISGLDLRPVAVLMAKMLEAKNIKVTGNYNVANYVDIDFYADGQRGTITIVDGLLRVLHPRQDVADKVRDIMLPLLQALAAKELQTRVAKWAAANTKVKGAQQLADGTLMIKVSI